MNEERDFQTQVLTRLAVIESKIDDYKNIKEKTDDAYNRSHENEKEIEEIKDKIRWLTRTITGAIISALVALLIAVIKVVK